MTNQFGYILQIWDVTTGECLITLAGHTDWVRTLCILPNGLLASGSVDKTIKVTMVCGRGEAGGGNSSSVELDHIRVRKNHRKCAWWSVGCYNDGFFWHPFDYWWK